MNRPASSPLRDMTERSGAYASLEADLPLETVLLPATLWPTITEAWTSLAAASATPNVFLDPAFALPAAAALAPLEGLCAVCVWQGGRLIAFAPGRRRRAGLVFEGWTHAYAPFGEPLIRTGYEAVAMPAIMAELASTGCIVALWSKLPADGTAVALLGEQETLGHARETVGSTTRAMFAPDDAAHLTGGVTKEARRQARRLADRGTVTTLSTSAGWPASEAITAFIALEQRGWKGERGSALASNPPARAFFEASLTSLVANGQARVDAIGLDGHPLAMTVTLFSGNRAWYWKTAYDEAFGPYSPGVQATLALSAELARMGNIALTDSCALAGHSMIERFWARRATLNDVMIAVVPGAPSPAFSALAAATRLETRLRDVARATLVRLRGRR